MSRIRALVCRAHLDNVEPELRRARARAAAGDESWTRWVADFDDGCALILCLELSPSIDDNNGFRWPTIRNRDVWVERNRHPAVVAGQVQEAVSKDFEELAAELRSGGIEDVTASDLAMMYIEVQLGDDVLAALRGRAQPQRDDGA